MVEMPVIAMMEQQLSLAAASSMDSYGRRFTTFLHSPSAAEDSA
jgi:hypothetical protein